MITPSYSFNAGKVAGNPLTAGEVNYLFRVIDSQLNGAIRAMGVGVIVDDISDIAGASELLVSSDGSELSIAPGSALLLETTIGYGGIYARFITAQILSIGDLEEGDNFIYLVPRFAIGENTLDTRQGDEPTFQVFSEELEDSGDGALLLARVPLASGVIGEVEDRRAFVSMIALLQRIAQLESDLAYDAAERAKGSVAARLNALAGTGDGDTPAVLWGDLHRTAVNAQTIEELVDAKLAMLKSELLDAVESGGERESPSETDQIWVWLVGYRRVIGLMAPSLLRFLPGGGAQPGLHGTDSAPDTEQYDMGGTLLAVPNEREYDSR